MAHLNTRTDAKPAVQSKEETRRWINVSAQVGEFVNDVARRNNIVAKVGPECGQGNPACFSPHIAEVEVNTKICLPGVDPAEVALNDERFKLGHAPFVGAISHEAAHAQLSAWVPATLFKAFPELSKRIIDVFMVLEESRIEAHLVRQDHFHSQFLRASAGDIIARDFKLSDDPYGASMAAALLLARVDANVLTEADTDRFLKPITEVLGDDVLDKLRALWIRFQRLNLEQNATDPGTLEAIEISKAWLDVLDIEHDDPEPNLSIIYVVDGGDPGEGGEGEGEGEGEGGEGGGGKSLADAAREMGIDIDTEMAAKRRKADAKADREARASEGKRGKEAKDQADKIFRPAHGLGWESDGHLRDSRSPTPAERAAAVQIARELEKAQYRDRVVTRVKSVLPPGRLRSRGAVQRAAEKSRGAMQVSEAWKGRRKAHIDEPPLVCGVMTDISGSMGGAEVPSAVLSWVMSEAVRRIHGKVATVLFGVKVHGVVKAGARQHTVNRFSASDGHEAFKPAFQALDGELNILNAPGAKLLVILSDAHFVNPSHAEYSEKVMGWCKERGVAVLWIDITGSFLHNHGWGEVVEAHDGDPLKVARKIGQAAVEAVKKADKRGNR